MTLPQTDPTRKPIEARLSLVQQIPRSPLHNLTLAYDGRPNECLSLHEIASALGYRRNSTPYQWSYDVPQVVRVVLDGPALGWIQREIPSAPSRTRGLPVLPAIELPALLAHLPTAKAQALMELLGPAARFLTRARTVIPMPRPDASVMRPEVAAALPSPEADRGFVPPALDAEVECADEHQTAIEARRQARQGELIPMTTPSPTPQAAADEVVSVDWSALVSDHAPDAAFPVDFEALWEALGYSAKDKAVRALRGAFIEGEEFCSPEVVSKEEGEGRGGHNRVAYWLTLTCAKEFCLLAGTDAGKRLRRYFIRVEERQRQPQTAPVLAGPERDLALVERGMRLLVQLDALDPRTRLMLADRVKDALSPREGRAGGEGDAGALARVRVDRPEGWQVGERIEHLGHRYDAATSQIIGRRMASWHRKHLGGEPMSAPRYIDGAVRQVKLYTHPEAIAQLDLLIREWHRREVR